VFKSFKTGSLWRFGLRATITSEQALPGAIAAPATLPLSLPPIENAEHIRYIF
jgi:hypothetical protein